VALLPEEWKYESGTSTKKPGIKIKSLIREKEDRRKGGKIHK